MRTQAEIYALTCVLAVSAGGAAGGNFRRIREVIQGIVVVFTKWAHPLCIGFG